MAEPMVELATCSVCLVVRVGERLLVCQAGHLLCCPCYNLLQPSPRRRRLCPLATCKFDSPPRRCRVAEWWVERTVAALPCRFVVEGCEAEVARGERREHEAACVYRVEGEAAVPVVEERARLPRRRLMVDRLDREVAHLLTTISLILAAISLAMFVVLAFNVLKVGPERQKRAARLKLELEKLRANTEQMAEAMGELMVELPELEPERDEEEEAELAAEILDIISSILYKDSKAEEKEEKKKEAFLDKEKEELEEDTEEEDTAEAANLWVRMMLDAFLA